MCSPPGYMRLLTSIASFRSSLENVETYAHLPIPLVYTQVGSNGFAACFCNKMMTNLVFYYYYYYEPSSKNCPLGCGL